MYIDSHLERCILIQKGELYTSGKYLNWNLKLCPICIVSEIAKIAVEIFQSHPTGEVWCKHRFPSGEVCFGPKSRVVHLREVSELGFKICPICIVWEIAIVAMEID